MLRTLSYLLKTGIIFWMIGPLLINPDFGRNTTSAKNCAFLPLKGSLLSSERGF